jgi:glycosyltransferase involved in cell wall biosynthesis
MRVLVTHPGRQHSHQAALALDEAGLLAGYWAGVPALAEQMARVPAVLRQRLGRYEPVPIDPSRSAWHPQTPALRRLGDLLLPPRGAAWADYCACRRFDRWAARRLGSPRVGIDAGIAAVIACEISALTTFERARQLGIATILDAPSLHHRTQDRLHGTTDSPALHWRVTRVKDLEIALADHVLTVSELARETYLEAGVPAERVHAVPLGADIGLFTPAAEPRSGELRFLFSGATIHRKGFDLLLDAFAQVHAEEPGVELRIVGPKGDAFGLLGAEAPEGISGISVVGPVSQRELAQEFRQADCLVLPSRNDSYGMVVAEALAAGLPVLVSDMVGAKALVEPGRNGWIVPAGDDAALAERMLGCARNPEAVRGMRDDCRRAAEAATWPAYRRRFADLIRALVPEGAR